jgi:hypothetical protein
MQTNVCLSKLFFCILHSLGVSFLLFFPRQDWFQFFHEHMHSFLHDYKNLGRCLPSRLFLKKKENQNCAMILSNIHIQLFMYTLLFASVAS